MSSLGALDFWLNILYHDYEKFSQFPNLWEYKGFQFKLYFFQVILVHSLDTPSDHVLDPKKKKIV